MQKQRRTATAQLFQLRRRHRPRIRAHRKSGATIHSVCPRHRMRLDKANEAPLHTEIRKRATGSLGRDSPKRRSADMRLSHANIREGCDVPSRLDRRKDRQSTDDRDDRFALSDPQPIRRDCMYSCSCSCRNVQRNCGYRGHRIGVPRPIFCTSFGLPASFLHSLRRISPSPVKQKCRLSAPLKLSHTGL